MPFIASKINAQAITISLHSSIEKAICKSFGITDFEYGVFCGSPGRHQKITIMINQGKKCLGYCKVTDNPEVFAIFQKESADLLYLKTKGVSCIPEILFVNEIKDLPYEDLLLQFKNEVQKQKDAGEFDYDALRTSVEAVKMFVPNETYENMRRLLDEIED